MVRTVPSSSSIVLISVIRDRLDVEMSTGMLRVARQRSSSVSPEEPVEAEPSLLPCPVDYLFPKKVYFSRVMGYLDEDELPTLLLLPLTTPRE